jgi:RNA polymerase sigma-70 factor (ECF subfamily)
VLKEPPKPELDSPQLFEEERVSTDVSSLALRVSTATAVKRPVGEQYVPAVEGPSDADLMLRAQSGDMAAFDALVMKFRRPLVGFMFRMARNQAVAEELAQEVFLRVYRSRDTYAAEAKFSTWLYRIATNLALNHIRDTRHERAEVTASIDEPDEETGRTLDVADAHPTAEQEMLQAERVRQIRAQVDSLPERQRLAVVMHKYQGLDYKEIGKVLKLSESATKSLLFRAYEALREKLKDFV